MRMNRMVRAVLCIAAVMTAAVVMIGCGGDDGYYRDDRYYGDRYYDDHRDRDLGSYQKTLFVYLNVADQDGDPLEGATVWVDSRQQDARTESEYRRLGEQFPPDWRGWHYNWSGGPYWIDLRDCSNLRCTIEILVSRSGYETQRTTIPLERRNPDEIYMRQTFVMERRIGTAGVDSIVDAPRPAEMISLTDPRWRG